MNSSISAISDRLTSGASAATSAMLWNGHLVHDIVDHHLGRDAVAGGVRAEPDAVAEDVPREILHVFRIDLAAFALEQRPHFHEAPPADRRAWRRAEVHALLDELGRRAMRPLGFGV